MRAVGIPVRIVNGVTLREPYHIRLRGGTLTQRMAQGRHSWIEVWFPDLGWVPFDPQQMQMFVSNRFVRVEVGLDNRDAVNDGTVMWTRERGSRAVPRFSEKIAVDFDRDRVDLAAVMQRYGPRKMLFTPPVEAAFVQTAVEHSSAAPESFTRTELNALSFSRPFIHGNLEFPENYNFLEPPPVVESGKDGAMRLERQYIVETSEYVTTKGHRYAQAFILDDPILLEKTGLSLHAFGGSGQLWIELLEDRGGKPGKTVATSEIKPLTEIHGGAGYTWVDFDFTAQSLKLPPGRYWLALAYTGSPIVSWFFTYGKPTGPPHGTRYNTMFDETWSHSLTYEFNYRVMGRLGE
jgi:hypothetical protein